MDRNWRQIISNWIWGAITSRPTQFMSSLKRIFFRIFFKLSKYYFKSLTISLFAGKTLVLAPYLCLTSSAKSEGVHSALWQRKCYSRSWFVVFACISKVSSLPCLFCVLLEMRGRKERERELEREEERDKGKERRERRWKGNDRGGSGGGREN